MIAEYGWSIVIAVYLVWALGVAGLAFALLYIADKTFQKALKSFKLYDEFRQFLLAKYRPKRKTFKPKGDSE